MLYLTGVTNPTVWPHIEAGRLGLLITPGSGYKYRSGPWAADNGCFNAKTYKGDDHWFAWLRKMSVHADTCLFAAAPDVVGDFAATLVRSRPWFSQLRALGYPAALVAQDGATPDLLPWGEFDVLFIGGTDEFKLSREAAACVAAVKERGLRAHMGRVNSAKRTRYAIAIGCDTVDGTVLKHDPARLSKVLRWGDPDLFSEAAT